jgi:ribose 5-phosphate isomerase RpiB
MKKDLDGNPFAGLAQAMVQAVSLDFGIGVIVVGAGLFIAAAVIKSVKRA